MKIFIVYATKTGTTAECAGMLTKKLGGQEVTLCDLDKMKAPELSDFDAVAVGGPVRFGKLHKKVRNYLAENAGKLSQMRTAYFVCCGFADRAEEYFEDNLTEEQLKSACFLADFGGTLKVDRQKNFIMKQLVRTMRNEITENGDSDDESAARILPEINTAEIGKLADVLARRA